MDTFRSGYVSIVGRPNVGKSTLMNRLVGENLSIATPKAQTTRHRVMGILNGDGYQIVYSDTPGILEPKYALHEAMMSYVKVSLEDADTVLLVVEPKESFDEKPFGRFKKLTPPLLVIINKSDTATEAQLAEKAGHWKAALPNVAGVIPVSALTGNGVKGLMDTLLGLMPIHPPYFPQDELSNRSERFFASEIIREKIFMNYKEEVPYSTEVAITEFNEAPNIIRMRAELYVERETQKSILIGKGGACLKKVGMEARKDLEVFFQKKVFLETYVKVAANWRKEKSRLKQFGYME